MMSTASARSTNSEADPPIASPHPAQGAYGGRMLPPNTASHLTFEQFMNRLKMEKDRPSVHSSRGGGIERDNRYRSKVLDKDKGIESDTSKLVSVDSPVISAPATVVLHSQTREIFRLHDEVAKMKREASAKSLEQSHLVNEMSEEAWRLRKMLVEDRVSLAELRGEPKPLRSDITAWVKPPGYYRGPELEKKRMILLSYGKNPCTHRPDVDGGILFPVHEHEKSPCCGSEVLCATDPKPELEQIDTSEGKPSEMTAPELEQLRRKALGAHNRALDIHRNALELHRKAMGNKRTIAEPEAILGQLSTSKVFDDKFNEELSFRSMPKVKVPRVTFYDNSPLPPKSKNLLKTGLNSKAQKQVDSQTLFFDDRHMYPMNTNGYFAKVPLTNLNKMCYFIGGERSANGKKPRVAQELNSIHHEIPELGMADEA